MAPKLNKHFFYVIEKYNKKTGKLLTKTVTTEWEDFISKVNTLVKSSSKHSSVFESIKILDFSDDYFYMFRQVEVTADVMLSI